MKKSIFYSWQSDLPNSTNRGLIEGCLKKAVIQISENELHLEVAIDRDTLGTAGTPEIANTIFDKIDRCNIFIADISLVNQVGKRTPNPNVLLELGYAAKVVGWENIICVFNSHHGQPEELPFDLRFRRPLMYVANEVDDKTIEKKKLISTLKIAITSMLAKQRGRDMIYNNIKVQVDHHLMAIANLFYKWMKGYKVLITPHDLFELIDLTEDQIRKLLAKKEFLGFQILRDTEKLQTSFQQIISNPIFAKHIDDDKVASLITLINALYYLNENVKQRRQLFIPTGKKSTRFSTVSGASLNASNSPNSFLLLGMKGLEKGVVFDGGEFQPYYHDQLNILFTISDKELFVVILMVKDIFKAVDDVVKNWGNSVMLNPALL